MEFEELFTVYLDAADLIGLHAELFACSDQQAADRRRSRDMLEGATARPRQHAFYAGADLALQAAVLAHAIAEGQPFVDGNKRTALPSLRTFLMVNGYQVTTSQRERADWMLRLSEGASKDDLSG